MTVVIYRLRLVGYGSLFFFHDRLGVNGVWLSRLFGINSPAANASRGVIQFPPEANFLIPKGPIILQGGEIDRRWHDGLGVYGICSLVVASFLGMDVLTHGKHGEHSQC